MRSWPLKIFIGSALAMLGFITVSYGQGKLLPKNSVSYSKLKPKTHVIAIGINSFADSFWPSLKWAEQDVQNFINTVATGNPNVSTLVLLGKEATTDQIADRLKAYAKKVRPRDSVVLYISTHGTLQKLAGNEFERIVVTHDTKKDQVADTGLSHTWLREWLADLPAKKRAGIFATCFSGVGKSKLPSQVKKYLATLKSGAIPLEDISEGFLVLSASTMSEPAEESDQLEGDVYTHFLLEGLQVYDRNRDGAYGLMEAHDYATQKTYGFTNGRQKPSVSTEQIGEVDIILRGVRKKKGLPVLYGYDKEYEGLSIRVGGNLKGDLPTAMPLKMEKNLIEISQTDTEKVIATYELSAKSGEQISMADLLRPPPFYVGLSTGLNVYLGNAILQEDSPFWYSAEAGWQHGKWRLWVYFLNYESESEKVKEGLDFERSVTEYGVGGTYIAWRNKTLNLGLTSRISYSHMDVRFSDVEIDAVINEKDSSVGFSVGAELEVASTSRFAFYASTFYNYQQYDFKFLGKPDASHMDAQLGVRYFFGARAKKL